jgi:hypothetical protein
MPSIHYNYLQIDQVSETVLIPTPISILIEKTEFR